MKQQTAVEWLMEKNSEQGGILTPQDWIKAKAMEKQQIIDAYKDGNHSEMRGGKVIFEKMEKYYNETYGK
jgi:hypothetical protein